MTALLTAEYLFAAQGVHVRSPVRVQVEAYVTLVPGGQTEQGVHVVAPTSAQEVPSTQGVHTLSVVGEQADESTEPEAHVGEEQELHARPLADHVPAAQAMQVSEGASQA